MLVLVRKPAPPPDPQPFTARTPQHTRRVFERRSQASTSEAQQHNRTVAVMGNCCGSGALGPPCCRASPAPGDSTPCLPKPLAARFPRTTAPWARGSAGRPAAAANSLPCVAGGGLELHAMEAAGAAHAWALPVVITPPRTRAVSVCACLMPQFMSC